LVKTAEIGDDFFAASSDFGSGSGWGSGESGEGTKSEATAIDQVLHITTRLTNRLIQAWRIELLPTKASRDRLGSTLVYPESTQA
jgi:hypothetical protein